MPKRHSLVFAIALSLAACDMTEPTRDVTLRIEGTVTNAATGAPIQGANVRFTTLGFMSNTRVVSTNAEGRYSISHEAPLCEEIYVLEPSVEGFHFITATGYLPRPRCTDDVQRFDFALRPNFPQPT